MERDNPEHENSIDYFSNISNKNEAQESIANAASYFYTAYYNIASVSSPIWVLAAFLTSVIAVDLTYRAYRQYIDINSE